MLFEKSFSHCYHLSWQVNTLHPIVSTSSYLLHFFMLGFASKTMGSKSCAIISQPSLDDPELFELFREMKSLHIQYNKLEETLNPAYTSLTKGVIKTYDRFEKMLKEQTTSSNDSFSSSCSTSRHQLSSPTKSKGLFRELANDTSLDHMQKILKTNVTRVDIY